MKITFYKLNLRSKVGALFSLLILTTFFSVTSIELYNSNAEIALVAGIIIVFISIVLLGKIERVLFISLIIFGTYAVISAIFSRYGSFGGAVSFITSMMMMVVMQYIQLDIIVNKFMKICLLVFIGYSFVKSIEYLKDYWFLAHNYIGANAWGKFVMFSSMLYIVLSETKQKKNRFINFTVLGVSICTMINFRSRGTIIASTAFFLCALIPINKVSKKVIRQLLAWTIIAGLFFPIIYVLISKTGYSFSIFDKGLFSGRQVIWANAFSLLNEHPISWLFGLGSNAPIMDDDSLNLHNNYYGIIVNFGLLGFLLYYGTIVYIIEKALNSIVNDKRKWLAYSMFVCSVLLLGATEITSFWINICSVCYISLGIAAGNEIIISKKI